MTSNTTIQDLCKAIQEHDSSKVRSILATQDSDPSICIDKQNSDGWSALMFAAKYNDVLTAQGLIKRRSESNGYHFLVFIIEGISNFFFLLINVWHMPHIRHWAKLHKISLLELKLPQMF